MRPGALAAILLVLSSACRPGEPPGTMPRPGPAPDREPLLRVGITVDSTAALVSAPVDFRFHEGSGAVLAEGGADEVWIVTATAENLLEARAPDGRRAGPAETLRVAPRAGGMVTIAGRPYRGEAVLIPRAGGRVTAINVVQLELYLLGVVPREIGRRPAEEIEAVKAQAVAARTYAIGNLASRASLGFDVYASVLDQAYGGVGDEDTIVSGAVRETRGEILTYAGRPILAYYSSTCGGRTAAIEDAWPWRAPLPYLRSVSDRVPGTDEYYCQTSNRFRWTTAWTRQQLLDVLAQTLPVFTRGPVPPPTRISTVERTDTSSSGNATLRVATDARAYVLRADSLRWVLRPQPGPAILNSSRLDAVDAAQGNGGVESLEIRGRGWGHGIGMCQVGAMGRARAGQSYEEILMTYYSGAKLERIY